MEAAIPDPNSPQTFLISKIDWNSLKAEVHGGWLDYYSKLLKLRRDAIIPRLPGMEGHSAHFEAFAPCGLRVQWQLGDGSTLRLLANFSSESVRAALPAGRVLFTSPPDSASSGAMKNTLGPCSVVWTLEPLPIRRRDADARQGPKGNRYGAVPLVIVKNRAKEKQGYEQSA